MFCTLLRQLNGTIAIRQSLLADALHLVAEDVGRLRQESEVLQRHTVFDLLDGKHLVMVSAKLFAGIFGGGKIAPAHGFIGTQGGLVDFAVRRTGRDATQIKCLDAKSIGGAEKRAHIAQRADVVEY